MTDAPVVVGVLYPEWYHGGSDWPELQRLLEAVDPRVEVRRVAYEETTERRAARGAGESVGAGPELTAEQRQCFAEVEAALVMDLPLDVGSVAPRLRWVQGLGAGVAHLPLDDLFDAGVRVANGAGLSSDSIAEFVIGRLLQIWKDFPRIDQQQARREWKAAYGRTLRGSTVVVVGLGAIGSALSERLAAFGVTVIGCRRRTDQPPPPGVTQVVTPAELDTATAQADIVVAALPETDATVNLFDAARFANMRAGAVFVNVGRGSAVVEDDLRAALEAGQLSHAVIDVVRVEPLPPDDPLWEAPNLLLSPHASASADRYMENLHELFRSNLRRYLDGVPLVNELDATRGY